MKKKERIIKINKTKTWFFEKINEIDRQLAKLIKKKREKTQINIIRNEKWEVTRDNAETQRIMRLLWTTIWHKIDNLEETHRFLEKFSLPRLNQEEIEIMNNPILKALKLKLWSKISQKTKPRIRWLHRRILSNI